MADDLETQDLNDETEGKKKKSSSLKMILIVLGVLVINAVIVVGVVKFFFADAANGEQHKEAKAQKAVEKTKDEFAQFKDDEENFFEEEKDRKMLTTDRITTNPANSISKLIVVNLGLEYRIKPDLPEEEFEAETPLMQKLMIRVKAAVLQKIGSMGVEELVRQRGELPEMFKKVLQPIFNENQMYLRAVYLNEFLIQ
jgi:flagellar basal body-associated protein FliL